MVYKSWIIRCLTTVAITVLIMGNAAGAAERQFSFTLKSGAVTSAGVYTHGDRLVRSLWAMERLESGTFTRTWDGNDDFGVALPAGEYTFKVAANRATYRNVGAIGNSQPHDSHSHTPAAMFGVAVDEAGCVYTANGWDEAGADFKKWTTDGVSVYDADYAIRNGQPNGAPYTLTTDDKYLYCAMGGWADPTWKEAQQIQRFSLQNGKPEKFTESGRSDGHIQIYEWPSKQTPPDAPANERELYKAPLRALAVRGEVIYVADFLGNRILKFHKTTGKAMGEFAVARPQAMAFDPNGNLWIGHQHHLVSIYDTAGTVLGEPLKDLGDIEQIAINTQGQLVIADSGAAQFKSFRIDHLQALPGNTQGTKAGTGDRDPSYFYHLRGIAIDIEGNIFTTQTEPAGGARLAKWRPDGSLGWEQFGCEFVSLGGYAQDDPSHFYSMTFHGYDLMDFNAGKWKYVADMFSDIGNDADGRRRYSSDPHGVPRVIHVGHRNFFFMPQGDGMQVYMIKYHEMHLAALVGGRSPSSTGEHEGKTMARWSWSDTDGSGNPKSDQIVWAKKAGEPGADYSVFGMDVDTAGNIIYADQSTHSVWEIPIGPVNSRGNPTYDWTQVREVLKRDTSPLKFEPTMVQDADDGSFYAFGWSAKWPQPQNNPFWMGGTTAARFDKMGNVIWAAKLPRICVGLDTIPGGGCFVGQGDGAKLHHYTADGLYVGMCEPGEAMNKQSGWLDNHASVAVCRNPRDHVLDVFAEDDFVLRIGWYRVDDSQIEIITGKF